MAITAATFFVYASMIVVGLVFGWFFSGKTRIYQDMAILMTLSMTMVFFALFFIEYDYRLSLIGVLIGMVFIAMIGFRVNQTYTKPLKEMELQLKSMQESMDFRGVVNMTFNSGYDYLRKLLETQINTLNLMLNIIGRNDMYNAQTEKLSISVSKVSSKLEAENDQIIDGIDKNLQSAVIGNEISEKIQNHINELAEEFKKYNRELTIAINSADSLSDQTNLVAVNAAIEAAQSEAGENFAIVADGIQRLSMRSRETATRLSEISMRLNRMMTEKLGMILDEFQGLDGTMYEIAEISDNISSLVHEQRNMSNELNRDYELLLTYKHELESAVQNFTY